MKLLNNLRVRLVLWTVILEAVLLVIFAGILLGALQNTLNQQTDETLRLGAAQMNAVVDIRDSRYEIPSSDTVALRARGLLVWVLSSDGRVGATVGQAEDIALPAVLPDQNETLDITLENGEPARVLSSPLNEGNQQLGTLVLAVSLQNGRTFLRQVLLSLTIALPVVLILSAAGGLFLASRALAPVAVMTNTARQISAADLSQRLALNLPDDEIGRLAQTFNAMLDRIDRAFQRERQLTSDVSHELRTPLGMLKTQLSLARSRPREVRELLQMMTAMEGDVDRMTRLVEQMLTLARVEQRGFSELTIIDMDQLIESITARFQELADSRDVRLVVDRPLHLRSLMKGDAGSLRQVFTNLIENAIKYSDEGGDVTISISQRWQELIVSVANTGNGIAQEHLPHIFERFYRTDSARTRSTGGFGLGLAISYAIVQAHGGTINVESEPGGTTTFTVLLSV